LLIDSQIKWLWLAPNYRAKADVRQVIDGLDPDPCNSRLIPLVGAIRGEPVDTDEDGVADDDEIVAGTDPFDPNSSPVAFGDVDLDLDLLENDRLWLEDSDGDGVADSVAIDINSNVLIDARVAIVKPRDVELGDFDGDLVIDAIDLRRVGR